MTAQDTARARSIYLGPWRVDVTTRQGVAHPLPDAGLARAITAALEAGGAPRPSSVGLVLSGDRELAELDRTHMGVEGPTDVLSFPLLPPEAFPIHDRTEPRDVRRATDGARRMAFVLPPGRRQHLGDIVVSVERAIEQAEAGRGGQTGDVHWSPADELRLLVTHGALHLCGWDHAEPVGEAAMRALERRLLSEADASAPSSPGDRSTGGRGRRVRTGSPRPSPRPGTR